MWQTKTNEKGLVTKHDSSLNIQWQQSCKWDCKHPLTHVIEPDLSSNTEKNTKKSIVAVVYDFITREGCNSQMQLTFQSGKHTVYTHGCIIRQTQNEMYFCSMWWGNLFCWRLHSKQIGKDGRNFFPKTSHCNNNEFIYACVHLPKYILKQTQSTAPAHFLLWIRF